MTKIDFLKKAGNCFFLFLIMFQGLFLQAQTPEGWKLYWEDDFNGSKTNPSRWGVYGKDGEAWASYMRDPEGLLSTFSGNNVRVEKLTTGGKESVSRLVSTKNGPDPKWIGWNKNTYGPGWYTGGLSSRDAPNNEEGVDRNNSRFYPLYSRIEIKAKIDYVKGTWPAIWLRFYNNRTTSLDSGCSGAPCAELDILEFFVGNNPTTPTLTQNTHLWNTSKGGTEKNIPKSKEGSGWVAPKKITNPGENFHIYGVQIREDSRYTDHAIIEYLYDGEIIKTLYTKSMVNSKGESIGDLINSFIKIAKAEKREQSTWDIAITNKVGGKVAWGVGYPDSRLNSHEMVIDWVRVYVKDELEPKPSIENLYIIGDATSGKWNLAQSGKMTLKEGVFEWSGSLTPGDFKFILNQNSWHPALYSEINKQEIILGETYNTFYSQTSNRDYQFRISEAGNYTVTVDPVTLTVTVKEDAIYPVGTATNWGWDKNIAEKMTPRSEGKHTWSGYLKNGYFKFLLSRESWHPSLYSTANGQAVASEQTYTTFYSQTSDRDYQFKITQPGNYTLVLDKANGTLEVKENTVYMVGTATNWGWDKNIAEKMTPTSEGKHTWSGYLKNGYFKFLLSRESWHPALYSTANGQVVTSGQAYTTFYSQTSDRDYQFKITQPGNYIVMLDVEGNNMIVNKAFANALKIMNASEVNNDINIISMQGYVEVRLANGITIEQAELVDMFGRTLAASKNNRNNFTLGNNLSSGVYIVSLNYDNTIFTQKVIIK